MNNIALGRYIPLNSVVHKMDPRAKIMAMILMMIAVFLPSGFIGYIIIGICVFGIVLASKLKLSFIMQAMKPMFFMLCFLMVINMMVIRTGDVLIDLFGIKIYTDAIIQTLYITIRLLLMIIITTLLTASTKPLDLTLGIETLLTPFKRIGVPAHEIAMMISIALRFIPTLIEETQRIVKAQTSRGVDLDEGSLKEKIMAILSLIVPLFVSAFQKAEDLANAMEARGYAPGATRTRYKNLVWQLRDSMLIGGCIVVIGVIGMVSFIL